MVLLVCTPSPWNGLLFLKQFVCIYRSQATTKKCRFYNKNMAKRTLAHFLTMIFVTVVDGSDLAELTRYDLAKI